VYSQCGQCVELTGLLSSPSPGWQAAASVGEEGCWFLSPAVSLDQIMPTLWLHFSRWRGTQRRTMQACSPITITYIDSCCNVFYAEFFNCLWCMVRYIQCSATVTGNDRQRQRQRQMSKQPEPQQHIQLFYKMSHRKNWEKQKKLQDMLNTHKQWLTQRITLLTVTINKKINQSINQSKTDQW